MSRRSLSTERSQHEWIRSSSTNGSGLKPLECQRRMSALQLTPREPVQQTTALMLLANRHSLGDHYIDVMATMGLLRVIAPVEP